MHFSLSPTEEVKGRRGVGGCKKGGIGLYGWELTAYLFPVTIAIGSSKFQNDLIECILYQSRGVEVMMECNLSTLLGRAGKGPSFLLKIIKVECFLGSSHSRSACVQHIKFTITSQG